MASMQDHIMYPCTRKEYLQKRGDCILLLLQECLDYNMKRVRLHFMWILGRIVS